MNDSLTLTCKTCDYFGHYMDFDIGAHAMGVCSAIVEKGESPGEIAQREALELARASKA